MAERSIALTGIIGASSFVGSALCKRMKSRDIPVIAFSRKQRQDSAYQWHCLGDPLRNGDSITNWLSLMPIQLLPAYFPLLDQAGARVVVALSSTSVLTKSSSPDQREKAIIHSMIEAEVALQRWAEAKGIKVAILRPTLIYGCAADRNITELARLIRKTRMFPLLDNATGLRQPVHVEDVAEACIMAMEALTAEPNPRQDQGSRVYNISGAEILPYHEMIRRLFIALGLRPWMINVPGGLFTFAVRTMNLLPRYRDWKPTMAERMNMDMVFSHEDARRDFGFSPRPFVLSREDLPD